MRVKCLSNIFYVNKENKSLIKDEKAEERSFPVIIDKEYIVYAMTVRDEYVWYYIEDEQYNYYPRWNCSILFDVIDNRLSRYWVYSYKKGINYIKAIPMWAYPEWAEDPDYYDRLTDGEDADIQIWKNYKEKMDLEFPDSTVTVGAQIGDEEWLICPECMDAWQSTNTLDALVICPKCKKKLNNPRYCCRAT